MGKYNTVKIQHGIKGWGGPLVLKPNEERKYVISVTGGGIHPVASQIAKVSGAIAVDAFKNPVAKEETLCAVIDCGGTARCGTYPQMRIPTINVKVQSPSGPLAKFITEDIFVSGIGVSDIYDGHGELIETLQKDSRNQTVVNVNEKSEEYNDIVEDNASFMFKIIDKVGRVAGDFINIMYESGRETVETVMKNIIPFMAFVATLIGIINYTGIGDALATVLSPLSGSIVGLIILGTITSLPFLSPLLAPGAVIAAVIGLLIGGEIAKGNVPAYFALPALFAIDSQVGCDFAPVGLTLGEATPKTISKGVPAILISRVITGPLAVVIAYFLSFGL